MKANHPPPKKNERKKQKKTTIPKASPPRSGIGHAPPVAPFALLPLVLPVLLLVVLIRVCRHGVQVDHRLVNGGVPEKRRGTLTLPPPPNPRGQKYTIRSPHPSPPPPAQRPFCLCRYVRSPMFHLASRPPPHRVRISPAFWAGRWSGHPHTPQRGGGWPGKDTMSPPISRTLLRFHHTPAQP